MNPCRNHAGAREREIEGQYTGATARVFICDSCLEREQAFLAKARPVFDAMIAAGVPRQRANELMHEVLTAMEQS